MYRALIRSHGRVQHGFVAGLEISVWTCGRQGSQGQTENILSEKRYIKGFFKMTDGAVLGYPEDQAIARQDIICDGRELSSERKISRKVSFE
jgi:hypothetical protein